VHAVRPRDQPIGSGTIPAAPLGVAALVALVPVLVLAAAVRPGLSLLSIPLLLIAAVAMAGAAVTVRVVAIVAAVTGVLFLAVLAALAPGAAALLALSVIALGAGWWLWRTAFGPVSASAREHPNALTAGALGSAAVVLLLLNWPVTVLLVAIVAGIVVLAWRAPAWALIAAVLLVGFEGSIKILLGIEGTPLGGNRAAGAAAIDIALFSAIAGVLIADRTRTPWSLWSRAKLPERRTILLLNGWLALSVLQIAQGGDLSRGLHGFRLFQAYTLVALAAAVVLARPRWTARATKALLAVGLVVGVYAALRVVVGPSDAESDFATSVVSVTSYGGALRAIGSFSSAIGLISFLAPITAFALVIGFIDRHLRRLAWAVAALCLVGLIGSYGRASLFGLALGLVFALVLVVAAADMPGRRKLAAAGLVVGLLLATYGGVLVASKASPQLHDRVSGILDPLGDKSVELRFENWGKVLRAVGHEPLGHGVGAAGSASAPTRAQFVTTDNSFLKVLYDQGVIGFMLFVGGVLAAVVLLARRLRRAEGESRAVGLAALAGFVTFLGISMAGEYVEQPGKVIAWGLLGVAAAQALRDPRGVDPDSRVEWRLPGQVARALGRVPAVSLPRGAPAAILSTAGLALVGIIMYLGRSMATFRLDEWAFVLDRQGNSVDDFLRPHNEHLSLVPVTIFKGLLATVGMDPYWPYRLVVAVLSVVIGVLVYLYARPRLGRAWALAPALLTMLVGQGGYDVVWPFQIGFDGSVACGVGMLLCFDRPGRRSDLVAGVLLFVALCSSSIGIAVAVAALIEVLGSPEKRFVRALRVLAVPIAAYALWWLHYRPTSNTGGAAGAVDSVRLLVDVSGIAGSALFGVPLSARRLFALALFIGVAVGLVRRRGDRRMLIVACSMPAAYWVLLILGRGSTGPQLFDSRYILPGAIFLGCVLSELLRGTTARARPWMAIPLALGVLVATANNVRYIHDIAKFETQVRGDPLRGELGALSLASQGRPVDPSFAPSPSVVPSIYAERYFEAVGRFGDPVPHAASVIPRLPPTAREAADRTYLGATKLRAVPAGAPPRSVRLGCLTSSGASSEFTVPWQGLAVRPAGGAAVPIALRRWGPKAVPVGAAGPGWAKFKPDRDDSATPLHVRVDGAGVRVCPLG
jgi:hypothetical protein